MSFQRPFRVYRPKWKASPLKSTEVARLNFKTLNILTINKTKAVDVLEGLVRKEIIPKIRITQHLQTRLDNYLNKKSRDGSYIELYADERKHLMDMPRWLEKQPFQVVEVGFNSDKEICKVALTTRFYEYGRRTVFLCLGMDGGIKTVYVTPRFKYRGYYQGPIPYLYASSFLEWMSDNKSIK